MKYFEIWKTPVEKEEQQSEETHRIIKEMNIGQTITIRRIV